MWWWPIILSFVLPGCRMGNNAEGRCSETSCCEFDSLLSYFPLHWISQSFNIIYNIQKRFFSLLYNLISNIKSTPNKVALPFDGDHSPGVFNVHSVIFVSISKDYVRNPNHVDLHVEADFIVKRILFFLIPLHQLEH